MLGAIIGDIVGSRFEFNNNRTENFDFFDFKCFFTDDSIMTAAISSVLASSDLSKDNIINTIKAYGKKYPCAGYGGRFRQFVFSDSREPYWSFGNGSAMRISPVGWIAKNEQEVKTLSKILTEVTHDHPEGLKGAEVTAMCIYLARKYADKNKIREYVENEYPIIKELDLENLRKTYKFNETCQESVPQAIYCFLISNSFEDCIRKTISIGGDSDTLAAISGAIAEAFYGIPELIKKEFLIFFNQEDRRILLKPVKYIYELAGKHNYFEL